MQLPADFIAQTRQLFGSECFERYLKSFEEAPPVSIRKNNHCQGLKANGSPKDVPWCRDAYYLEGRPQFTFDPLLHAGCYYVQEAASMFLDEVLRQHLPSLFSSLSASPHPLLAIDMCAAPGGKSTILLSALPTGSTLVSNEPMRLRAQILSENLQKWCLPSDYSSNEETEATATQSIVTNVYPHDIRRLRIAADLVLCDVPCSGEGMFRKDAATMGEWSLQNVEKCWRLQRDIVGEAWQCLREGGLMVYSTCTFNTHENEENIRWMIEELRAEPLAVQTQPDWQITGSLLPGFTAPVYRFIPGLTRGEGLFMAVMRKPAEPKIQKSRPYPTARKDLLKSIRNSRLNILPNDFLQALREAKAAGCPHVDVSYQQAISYLRREAIALPPDTPRGLVVVGFEGHTLGLVKNIGPRANNLYPKEWRIKSTHIPQDNEAVFRHSEQNPQ